MASELKSGARGPTTMVAHGLVAFAPVAGGAAILAAAVSLTTQWGLADADAEWALVAGLAVLAAMVRGTRRSAEAVAGAATILLALAVPVIGLLVLTSRLAGGERPVVRLAVVVGASLVPLWCVALEWTRSWLRGVGVVVVVLAALLVADIGRVSLAREEARDAAREVAVAQEAVDLLNDGRGEAKARWQAAGESAAGALVDAADDALVPEGVNSAADSFVDAIKGLTEESAVLLWTTTKDSPARSTRANLLSQVDDAAARAAASKVEGATEAVAAVRVAADALWEAKRQETAASTAWVSSATGPACAAISSALRAAGDGTRIAPRGVCTEVDDAVDLGEPLAVHIALVRLRVAEHRAAILERASDTEAVSAARAELSKALTTDRARPADVLPLEAAVEGASALADDVLPGAADEPRVRVDLLFWLVAAAAALLGWRALERLCARQEVGPVDLRLTSASTDADLVNEEQAFRVAAMSTVTEPLDVPGAAGAGPVAALSELVTSASGWVATVVTAARAVLNVPRGHVAQADLGGVVEGSSQRVVLVRLVDAMDGTPIATTSVTAAEPLAACAKAGHWVAATLTGRSSRVPSWSRWTSDTAPALAIVTLTEAPTAAQLQTALTEAPASGVLLVRLGNRLDLEGKHVEALAMYARALAAHPHYLTALYRLAISVTTLALEEEPSDDGSERGPWASTHPGGERERVLAALARACVAVRVQPPPLPLADDHAASVAAFARISEGLYRTLLRRRSWPGTLRRLLRRSERDTVLRRTGHPSARRSATWSARTARLVVPNARGRVTPHGRPGEWPAGAGRKEMERSWGRAQLHHFREQRVRAEAGSTSSSWQLSYNLACLDARRYRQLLQLPQGRTAAREALGRALDSLERALARPGSEHLAQDWLLRDPDLASIRDEPRFKAVVAAVAARSEDDRDAG